MTLQAGTRLGPYEILGPIGAGGMGEVYRACDTRLDRAVAIKVLSPQLAHSPESHQRFEREARTISALDHPHICPLYDVGRQDGTVFLVMQYLEGETLAARLARGALRLPEALNVAIQIAEAIDAMHQHGIVHRDLKPGNIMLTASGVKLLDFGLAKLQSAPVSVADATASMTQESPLTSQGSIVGTVQYMSPEQLQGKDADARSDHWAFGCILYEMVSSRRPFEATTPASLVAKILETSPPALSAAAPLSPPALDHVVQLCLAKDPVERWQSAHDLLLELRWVRQHASTPGAAVLGPTSGVRRRERLAWGGAVVALAIAATSLLLRRPEPTPTPVSRTELLLPSRLSLHDWEDGPVISPDGRTVAFAGVTEGTRRLYLRPVNASVIRALPGTEGAMGPFWSPDGRAIGFSVDDQIRRVDVTGGAVVTLGEYEGGFTRTATWNREGVVLFDGERDQLIRRMGERGTATAVTRLDASRKERSHGSPQFLPDGQHFLYFANAPEPALYVGSLGSTTVTRVATVASPARYAAGHLLYTRQRTLIARPFDPVRLEFRGTEFPIADAVVSGRFSASQNGAIAYRPAESDFMTLVWFDRQGSRHGRLGEPAEYRSVVLSQSGARVAVVRGNPDSADLWMAESAKGVFSRLTRDPGRESDPAWSPDERYLAYSKVDVSLGLDEVGLGVVRKDLVTGTDQAVAGSAGMYLDDWTADGRSLICRSGGSVFAVPASGTGASVALLRADIDELHVSADGRWVTYNSDESGEWEVYVASFPDFARKRQVSVAGGLQPHWRRDGRELFYMTPDGSVMSVVIRTVPELATEMPTTLFATNLVPTPGWSQYAVSPDGQRFLVMESSRQFFTLLQHRLSARAESQ